MKSPIHEHILVCLSPAPSNGHLIRTAGKMRDAFGGSLTALYVQTQASESLGDEDRSRLRRHTHLAESLGASVASVQGEDVAFQIAEFARLSGVTKILIGRSGSTRFPFGPKPLTERLIALAPYLDIYIIPDIHGENPTRRAPLHPGQLLPRPREAFVTLAILALSTAIGFLFHWLHFTGANTITVYLLGALLTALLTRNYLCSGAFSLASVLLFNFFFTEPRLSFYAYESGYPVTFGIMLLASLITGTLANRLSDQVRVSSQAAWRTQVLLETTQQLQKASDESSVLEMVAQQVYKLTGRPVELRAPDASVLRAHPEGSPFPSGQTTSFPISSGTQVFGTLVLPGEPPAPQEQGMLRSILGEGALALESHRNARQKEEAAILAKNEQLRANLLRSISHDLRTPLTSISGNAENLLANRRTMDEADQDATLTDIYEDAIWLNQLVENLLSITKIGEGRARLNLSTELVEDVMGEAARHVSRRNRTHLLETDLPEELLLARMDARLISQVLINLMDNALKYTPPGSRIRLRAWRQGPNIALEVSDNGPGIPDGQKDRVFDLFYTGGSGISDSRRSMGLGLALCRSIVQLHGGELSLTDHVPSGCVFTFTLPASEVPIHE